MKKDYNTIDWFCDNCGAYLNWQRQFTFDESEGTWVCEKCGFVNDVTDANTSYAEDNRLTTEEEIAIYHAMVDIDEWARNNLEEREEYERRTGEHLPIISEFDD